MLLPEAPQKPELPSFLAGNVWVEFHHDLEDEDALWRLQCGIRGEAPRPRREQKLFLNHLHSFDLGELVNAFKNHLWSRQGLIGFAVHYPSYQFLDVFCDRLVNEYRKRKMKRYEKPLEIQPLCMPVDFVMKIVKQHEKNLQRGDMIFGIKSTHPHLAKDCWQRLCQEFPADALAHRLIVIFAVSDECGFPDDVHVLDSPSFSVADAETWVDNFVEKFSWPEEAQDMAAIVDSWTTTIVRECQLGSELTLHIESVYHHLDNVIRLLQQKPTIAMFMQELQARSDLYTG